MDPQINQKQSTQLILVPHKDTIRLLEVYVKRSLSLNDGALERKKSQRKDKWVTMTKRQRRHSSNPALHLSGGPADGGPADGDRSVPPGGGPADGEIPMFTAVKDELPEEKDKTTKKSKKLKKSRWKSFLGLFSRKDADDRDEENQNPEEVSGRMWKDEALEAAPAANVPRRKSKRESRKKRLSRRLSLLKHNKAEVVSAVDISVEAVTSVEPTYAYYEKVSEELEKIVHEVKVTEDVKPLTDDEVIQRIIALTKEQGDAIDDKIKCNPTLCNFFQKMSYSSFQKLADEYIEAEAAPVQNPPTVTAPELVKLAFTLDFTARIAGLSRQNVGHITGLGNRYLQEIFEYNQVCSDHPWSDCDD